MARQNKLLRLLSSWLLYVVELTTMDSELLMQDLWSHGKLMVLEALTSAQAKSSIYGLAHLTTVTDALILICQYMLHTYTQRQSMIVTIHSDWLRTTNSKAVLR